MKEFLQNASKSEDTVYVCKSDMENIFEIENSMDAIISVLTFQCDKVDIIKSSGREKIGLSFGFSVHKITTLDKSVGEIALALKSASNSKFINISSSEYRVSLKEIYETLLIDETKFQERFYKEFFV